MTEQMSECRITLDKGARAAEEATDASVARVQQLLDRAQKGDVAVMGELRQVLDHDPGLWRQLGDLGAAVQDRLIKQVAGSDLVLGEAVTRQARDLKQQLAGPSSTPLERLLADQIVSCWLQVNYFDSFIGQFAKLSTKQAEHFRRLQDSAQRRHLTAIRNLATIRKLLPTTAAVAKPGLASRPQNKKKKAKAKFRLGGRLSKFEEPVLN